MSNWKQNEMQAIELINIAGKLWLEKNIELTIFRRNIADARFTEILNNKEFTNKYLNTNITIEDFLNISKVIEQLDLAPTRIDLSTLGGQWLAEKASFNNSYEDFVASKLANYIGKDKRVIEPKDVVLFGFGRIGRLVARELIQQHGKGEQLRLRAIVTRGNSDDEIKKRSSLLRKDSVHGKFRGVITEDYQNKTLIANGNVIHMIAADNPAEIDYTKYGIQNALLIDNSGIWRDEEKLSNHLKANGIDKVLLTAPGKGSLPNIVYGVNHLSYKQDDFKIFTAASCTTNAISPIIKVIKDKYGIESGHVETVHSYTNDQNLLDNYHKKYRRGRSAPMNMVITETGAASAITKVIPEMAGKFTGNAVRVPTPDVSLAILNLNLASEANSIEEVNNILKEAGTHGELVEQIDFSTSQELVSTDCIGNSHASIVDSNATLLAPSNKSIVLYVWYDNEYGYTRQVVRLAKYIGKVQRLTYY
ncbi:MAG: glyceraldehyde-3-phosphate dehydrogenase [Sphingobacteriales bacterium]|jgi:glyceraldehyde 3-phosphate dehydrogenase|nr:MAG: glyceraldehyde-3-phosphate dehydrogenase [Sphingobacteriales bacterium]